MTVGGVILAGGQSSRMGGGEKALLSLGATTLLDRAIARLGPQVKTLAINANRDLDRYAAHNLPLLKDTIPDYAGPLAGVLAGMRWGAGAGFSHIATVAGDTPFFPDTLVTDLQNVLTKEAAIAMAATPDPKRGMARQPTFALWPTALADDLETALQDGVRKIVLWTDRHGTALMRYDITPYDPFFNVNTPDDMTVASKMAAEFGL